MKINCIIVDDEPASREVLEKYVADCPNLQLVKSCKNAFEAMEVVNTNAIELIFLDINMPKLSGMKFYKSLCNPPLVIFTTAYPQYAVEGFEVDAVDYLLKPFPVERFLKAVNKTMEILGSRTQSSENNNNNHDYILLKSDKKLHRLDMAEVTHLEAVGDYVKVFHAHKFIMVHDTFQNFLSQLPAGYIERVHKSHAVALDKIEVIEGNTVKIGEFIIPIGQTYRSEFFKKINS